MRLISQHIVKFCILFLCFFQGVLLNAQININSGTLTGMIPVYPYWVYTYSQQIFTQSQINASSSGQITGLKFYLGSQESISNSNQWTVYIGHTSKTEFTSSSDWISTSAMTQVFSGTVNNIGGEVLVQFTTPFNYDNSRNIVVAVDENKSSYNLQTAKFFVVEKNKNMNIHFYSDTINPDPNNIGSVSGTIHKDQNVISFLGLTPNPIPNCPETISPLPNAANFSITPLIKWNAVSGATGYKISLGTTPNGTDILNEINVGNVVSHQLTNSLNNNATYYVTIKAYSGAGESYSCNSVKFTTAPFLANDACTGAIVVSTFPYTYNQNDGIYSTNNQGFIGACQNFLPAGMNDGLWYKIIGNGQSITVKIAPTATWNPEVSVYTGSCGNFICVVNADQWVNGQAETVTFQSVLNKPYFVNVGHYSYMYDEPEGNFTITVTTNNLATTEFDFDKGVSISPNPFSDEIYLKKWKLINSIAIFDPSGKLIMKKQILSEKINLSHLSSGIYNLVVEDRKGNLKSFKIIKK